MAAATLSVRPNRLTPGCPIPRPPVYVPIQTHHPSLKPVKTEQWRVATIVHSRRILAARAGSRADDSAPFDMSVENALKLLGVSESASFDDILRAKNSIVASIKDDQQAIAQVEAAYDMLLMRSLTQRRAGKLVDRSIRYADVKPITMVNKFIDPMMRDWNISLVYSLFPYDEADCTVNIPLLRDDTSDRIF